MDKLKELYSDKDLYNQLYKKVLKKLKNDLDIEDFNCLTNEDVQDIIEGYYLKNY